MVTIFKGLVFLLLTAHLCMFLNIVLLLAYDILLTHVVYVSLLYKSVLSVLLLLLCVSNQILFCRNNIIRTSNATYLQSCIYNNETDPFCPVFKLGDMVRAAGHNFSEMALKVGIFV